MTLYDIKPRFQDLLRPLVKRLYAWGATANQVTCTATLLSILCGAVLIWFPYPPLFLILPFFLFLRMALNAIDGMLAREFNQKTSLGAILNETGDLISDAALYLAFAMLPGVSVGLVVVTVLLAWLAEFCGIIAQTLNGQRDYKGPLGKSDRALLFGALGLAISLWDGALSYCNAVFWLAAALSIWTCINRCRAAIGASSGRAK